MAESSATADTYMLLAIRNPEQGRVAGINAALQSLDPDGSIVVTIIAPETVSDMLLAQIEAVRHGIR